MRNIVIFIAVALFLISLATAFNCNSLQGADREICNSIQNSELSQQEKELLIADIFNENQVFPEHDFIYYWNINLNLETSPDQTQTSLGTIRNAWLKILSLSPSVIEDNVLYGSSNGKLISEFNYNYQLPSGTASGDCKTRYYLESKKADLKTYLNNNLIGTSKISSFNINSNPDNLNFKAKLDIEVKYRVKHYERERYCCRYDDEGDCTRYCYSCEYDRTEYKTDKLTLTDNFNAKLSKINPEASFNIIDKYRDLTKGILKANNFTNLILEFSNSKYENSKYVYSFNYSTPYYILTLKADKLENTNFNNLNLQKSGNDLLITLKDDSNCKLKVYTHFFSQTLNCNSNYQETEFEIKTDKLNYYENETIKVEISPNVVVKVTYANQTKIVQGNAEFKAILYQNKITAELNGKTESRIINVKSKTNQLFVQNFVVLGFFSYFVYSFLKKYHQKAKLL